MVKLPDFEGLAIFAKMILEFCSFAGAAAVFLRNCRDHSALRGAHPMVVEDGLNEDAL
jgi:hypothetical protein